MPSPFPGMEPYIEPHWLDVDRAGNGSSTEIEPNASAGPRGTRAEERIAAESVDGEFVRGLGPRCPRVCPLRSADPAEGNGGIAINAPFKLVVELDPIIERFIRIIDSSGQLVHVIEFLSPTNKRQPGLTRYREKRDELLASAVHVVEVELVLKPVRRSPEFFGVK